jgi:high-affinity iron transporter
VILLVAFSVVTASVASANEDFRERDSVPRTLVHLLDYLARDYAGAVQNGKVISKSEYQEQREFSRKVGQLRDEVKFPPSASQADISVLKKRIDQLQSEIDHKQSPETVAAIAHDARADVIRLSRIATTPPQAPDLAQGHQVYLQRCAVCHGEQGHGDGAGAKGLDPKPINFHNPKVMAALSPLQVFDAVRLGVDGTAMAPQDDLSDQDTWDVAYFALTFVNNGKGPGDSSGGGSGGSSVDIARQKLKQAKQDYRAGRLTEAQDQALAAYLEGIEPIEPKLKASDPEFVSRIETLMMRVREAINSRQPSAGVDAAVSSALSGLNDVDARMQSSQMSPYMSFTAAAAILLREGFEAVLVILAFLGVVRTSGSRKAEQWLHGGWIVALGFGVLAWFFSGWLIGISGAQREKMEAITAFFSAGILLFVGFWLHQKTEIGRWKTFVETRIKAALEEKSLIGLAVISFIAVFRETLEVVLFLRAIWVDCGPAARTGMMAGVVCSFVGTMLLAWAAMRYSRKIPIRQLFTASSSIMAALAVMMIGKGIHSLQETGTLSITTAPLHLHSELLGIFPTWESLVSQLAILALIAILWAIGRKPTASPRAARLAQ